MGSTFFKTFDFGTGNVFHTMLINTKVQNISKRLLMINKEIFK